MRSLILLAVLFGEGRADVSLAPTNSGRLEHLRKGQARSFVDPRRGVSEIVFITDLGDDGPAPKWAKHRCGKALSGWLSKELIPTIARDFSSTSAACDGDVCSGPNERTQEFGGQAALYFNEGHLYAVVQTSQYISESEHGEIDAFVNRELKRANRATCP